MLTSVGELYISLGATQTVGYGLATGADSIMHQFEEVLCAGSRGPYLEQPWVG